MRTVRTKIIWGTLIGLVLVSTGSLADNSLRRDWLDTYPDACQDLVNAANSCILCHTSVPNLNDYGDDIAQFGIVGSEGRNSDGDWRTNINEIGDCTLPGDPASVPVDHITWGAIKRLFD